MSDIRVVELSTYDTIKTVLYIIIQQEITGSRYCYKAHMFVSLIVGPPAHRLTEFNDGAAVSEEAYSS